MNRNPSTVLYFLYSHDFVDIFSLIWPKCAYNTDKRSRDQLTFFYFFLKLTLGKPVSSHSFIISVKATARAEIYSGLKADMIEFKSKALEENSNLYISK